MTSAAEAPRNNVRTPTGHALLLGTSVDAHAESLDEFNAPTGPLSAGECFAHWVRACSAQGARVDVLAARDRLFSSLSTLSDSEFARLLNQQIAKGLPTSPWHPCVATVMLWQCVSRAPHLRTAIALLVGLYRDQINAPVNTTHFYLGQPQIAVAPDQVLLDDDGTLLEVAIAQGVAAKTVMYLMTLACKLAPCRMCLPAGFALTVGQLQLYRQLVAVELLAFGGFAFSPQALREARRRFKAGFGAFRRIDPDEALREFARIERVLLGMKLPPSLLETDPSQPL